MISWYRSSSAIRSLPVEEALGGLDGVDERVDLLERVVDVERRACGGGRTQRAHQRLRAVVAGPHRDTLAVHDRADVVRVNALDREADSGSAQLCIPRTVDGHAVDCSQSFQCALQKLDLVGTDGGHPQAVE